MPHGRPYPAETRVTVVAEIIAGDPIRQVAKRWSIPYATVEGWWREDRPADVSNARTRERMVEQLYDTAYDCLDGVRATARLLQDPAWTATQEAAGLASLVAALSDRSLRMLGGLRPADPDQRALDAGDSVDAIARPADSGV